MKKAQFSLPNHTFTVMLSTACEILPIFKHFHNNFLHQSLNIKTSTADV